MITDKDTASERQIKIIKAQLRKDADVMLQRQIHLNEISPEPLTRDEIVNVVHDYVIEQFYSRCANRGITVITFRDDELMELLEEYRTIELDHTPSVVVNGGQL